MDPAVVAAATQLGLGGIIFVIWVFDNRKISALEAVVKEQVEDKRLMREERAELIRLIRDVILRFRRDGRPGNTVTGIEEGEDGQPMANRVYGTTTAGFSYEWNDPVSQETYGLLEEEKAFNEAQDLATLTAMTTAYGEQRANPIQDFQVEPILAERRFEVASGGGFPPRASGTATSSLVISSCATSSPRRRRCR